MAITLANLNGVEKPRFAKFVREATFAKLAFYNSEALVEATLADLGLTYREGARTVMLPYWDIQTMTHVDLIDTNTATTVAGVTAGEQIGRVLYRGNAWGNSWLAKNLVGSDPIANVGELIGNYWANNHHNAILHIMAGLFGDDGGATSGLDDHYEDSTGDGLVTGTILRKGIYKMGDQFNKIALILCHSSVYALLDDNEDIIMVPDGANELYPTLRGTKIRILVDDSMPRHNLSVPDDVGENNSAVYFVGKGAFTYAALDEYLKPQEEASTGELKLHNRKVHIIHPNGVSWQSAAPEAGQALTPTNAQLATKTNWEVEWDTANIPIVRQDVAVSV